MRSWCARVFIGLGSNRGNRRRHLVKACAALAAHSSVRLIKVSPVYETAPCGGPPQADYLNAVAQIATCLSPRALREVCQRIERAQGRPRRRERWGPRAIDVDILLYGTLIRRTRGLVIPHPRLVERQFVLQPLHDIAPQVRHPQTRTSIRALWHQYRSSAA